MTLGYFEQFKKTKDENLADINFPKILDFQLNASIKLDDLYFKLIQPRIAMSKPQMTHTINRIGIIDRGDSVTLLRFYTNHHWIIQGLVSGSLIDENVSDVKLFYPFSAHQINDELAWTAWLTKMVASPSFKLEGDTFMSAWNNNKPIEATEIITSMPIYADIEVTKVKQFMSLYKRTLEGEHREFLLLTGQEGFIDNKPHQMAMIYCGINFTQADFIVLI